MYQLLMLERPLYRAALSRTSIFLRKSSRPPSGNRAFREYEMERGEYFTNPHEHVANLREYVTNLREYVTNLSEYVANMSRAPTIMSVFAPEAV